MARDKLRNGRIECGWIHAVHAMGSVWNSDSLPLLQAGLDHRKNLPITGRAPFTANKQHRHPESSQFLTTHRTPLLLLGTLNGPGIIPEHLPLGLGKILPRAGSADGIGKDFQPAVDIPFVESLQNCLDPSRSLIRCGSRGRLAFQRCTEAPLVQDEARSCCCHEKLPPLPSHRSGK
jgi:hypothetical protein